MLRYMTGGESHGKCLIATLDGIPAGLSLSQKEIDRDLARRMHGYGRGKRMRIESDKVEILAGVRKGRTIGSPIVLMIKNVDNSIDELPAVLHPRPGHADLAGLQKYNLKDVRSILERASARETAARVAAGAVAKQLLGELDISVVSHVIAIGAIHATRQAIDVRWVTATTERSAVRCADAEASKRMCAEIDRASKSGDTLGGIFEVIVRGVPPGLGSHAQWDRRIDGLLARAVMSIQAVKAVEIGMGFETAVTPGSSVHDQIRYDSKRGFCRTTNNAGGIEGGITNGEDIVVRAAMKPIATLCKPLPSVHLITKKPAKASIQRSDVCAVPAAGVVGEAVIALELAGAALEKFGGDSIEEMLRNCAAYKAALRRM